MKLRQRSNENSDNKKIIEGLKSAKTQFEQIAKDQAVNSRQKISVEDAYRSNLKIVNQSTGLNLQFDEQELRALEANLTGNSLENGFALSNAAYQNNINNIRQNGSLAVYLEAQEILAEVYGIEVDNPAYTTYGIGWGCGIALASNFVATLGLGACVTGVGCPLAIAGKALALAGVATSCT